MDKIITVKKPYILAETDLYSIESDMGNMYLVKNVLTNEYRLVANSGEYVPYMLSAQFGELGGVLLGDDIENRANLISNNNAWIGRGVTLNNATSLATLLDGVITLTNGAEIQAGANIQLDDSDSLTIDGKYILVGNLNITKSTQIYLSKYSLNEFDYYFAFWIGTDKVITYSINKVSITDTTQVAYGTGTFDVYNIKQFWDSVYSLGMYVKPFDDAAHITIAAVRAIAEAANNNFTQLTDPFTTSLTE